MNAVKKGKRIEEEDVEEISDDEMDEEEKKSWMMLLWSYTMMMMKMTLILEMMNDKFRFNFNTHNLQTLEIYFCLLSNYNC